MNRDLSKTLSFLVLHLLVGFSVAYAFTGSIALASGIALIEPVVNAFVFFFHEKIWNRRAGAQGRSAQDRSDSKPSRACAPFAIPLGTRFVSKPDLL